MSKKKKAGIILASIFALFIIGGVINFAIEIGTYDEKQRERQITTWAEADKKRCYELYDSGFYSGWIDGQPQNDQAQRQQLQSCLDRAYPEATKAYDSMQNQKEQAAKTDYEKNVWQIKNKHYADLRLFKNGSFDCQWLDEKIIEIKNTRKTNWSPLDQNQWNQMQNDYLTTQRNSCS